MKSMSFTSNQKWCCAGVFLMAAVPVVAYYVRVYYWLNEPGIPPLEKTARRLAGFDSVDCGAVFTADQNPNQGQAVAACEVKAFESRKAFRGRITGTVIGSMTDAYLVGTPGGKVYRVHSFENDLDPNTSVTNAVEEYKHPIVIRDPWPQIVERSKGRRYWPQ